MTAHDELRAALKNAEERCADLDRIHERKIGIERRLLKAQIDWRIALTESKAAHRRLARAKMAYDAEKRRL